MTPFRAFLAKESREIFRTWRIWVLPGMVLFFAVTSPIIALVTPALVESIAGDQPGVVIRLPDPTAIDAYRQFLKNLDQLLLLALIITSAGAVAAERRSGTAVLVLTKPLSRRGFIVAKIVTQQALLIGITLAGGALCTALTVALFRSPPDPLFLVGVLLWLAFALMMVAAMTFFSAILPTQGAAGAGLTFFFVSLLAGIWPPVTKYSFVGLMSSGQKLLGGAQPEIGWPVASAVLATIGFGALAVWRFEAQEL